MSVQLTYRCVLFRVNTLPFPSLESDTKPMPEQLPEDIYQQHIPLHGTPNFRDLGGRKNTLGQLVKRGKLFRSGFLSDLNASDWQAFASLNITEICDFRRHDEIRRHPTTTPFHVNINHLPIGDGSHHALIKKAFTHDDIDISVVEDFMKDINRDFVFAHADTYKDYFKHVLNLAEDEALLFHCSAGKDRTGFAAALTLKAIGVDKQGILDDYMLSSRFFHPEKEMERIIDMLNSEEVSDVKPEKIYPILKTEPSYIECAFEKIASIGGFEQYFSEYLDLHVDAIGELKNKLLES